MYYEVVANAVLGAATSSTQEDLVLVVSDLSERGGYSEHGEGELLGSVGLGLLAHD